MQKQKALIVDDYANLRRIMSNMVGQLGFEAEQASDDMEALAKLRASKFDMVVAANDMEPQTGFELLRRVRFEKDMRNMRFLLYSGKPIDPQIIQQHKRFSGEFDFLVKPFNVEALAKTLRNSGGYPSMYDNARP